MSQFGCVFYRGPSLLTGDPIVGVLTGLDDGSVNAKTGPIAQAWIIRSDVAPMDAKRENLDDAVCGDCKLRGRNGRDSGCYVAPWLAPYNVFRQLRAGRYPDVTWADLHALVEGRTIRLGAYGDPAAIPFEIWHQALATVAGWVGYTHQWTHCDRRFRNIVMASVDSPAEADNAWRLGWRTFRVRQAHDPLLSAGLRRSLLVRAAYTGEFVCPASDEAGHRTTCQACQLCRVLASPARSVAIIAHGHNGVMAAFHRRRPAEACA